MINDFILALLCPKCDKYPLLSLKLNRPKEVLIQCIYCGYKKYEYIDHYFHLMSSIISKNIEDIYCMNHKEKYINYCKKCKLHICEKCNNHQFHQLIPITNKISTTLQNAKIQEGYSHINQYCKELKSIVIDKLITQMNKIEWSYQSFKAINNNILRLLQCIIYNYCKNPYNYYIQSNIINMNDIYIYKNNKTANTLNDLINYYNSYIVVKDANIDISTFKNTKIINEHKDYVYSIFLLSDGKLASCSYDKTIKIFNLKENYNCDITIVGHTSCVNYICKEAQHD